MTEYFGMPRVSPSKVRLPGLSRLVVPVLDVLPMGIVPAVRLCQAALTKIVSSVSPHRLLVTGGEVGKRLPVIDVVYVD